MKEEKRRFSRVHFDVSAKLIIQDEEYEVTKICNLSVGGCLLEIGDNFPVGKACNLMIRLDGVPEGVSVEGEVVRSLDETVSVKFTRVDPENLFHLQNIIRYNSADPDVIEEEINEHPGLK